MGQQSNSPSFSNSNLQFIQLEAKRPQHPDKQWKTFHSDKGLIDFEIREDVGIKVGDKAEILRKPAPNGKYRLGLLSNVYVQNGLVVDQSHFLKI
jgi:hypothetical protein